MASTSSKTIHIAIVYPSGKSQKTNEEKATRLKELEQKGFQVTDLEPSLNAIDGITAGPALERAAIFSHALTNRKFDILMAGRGGYGTTELIPFLEDMLPPILPCKTLVGFSDISYLGIYLALRFPNFRYIHAKNAFSDTLFLDEHSESTVLFDLLKSRPDFHQDKLLTAGTTQFECPALLMHAAEITGVCIPLNLSLAESLAATKGVELPKNTILFLEDWHEYTFRLLRKIDSLMNSGWMKNVSAIVLGDFTEALTQNAQETTRQEFLQLIAHKINKPIIDFPIFGHGKNCFPLLANSTVLIKKNPSTKNVTLTLTHRIDTENITSTSKIQFPQDIPSAGAIHLSGIGGTGMASVAGLLKSAGYKISGSDHKIYPPMDKVLENLQIVPDVGFTKENILNRQIDAVIMGNIMSRKTAALQKNEELEEILQSRIPIMSFPSALRKIFLHKSFNIVVSGTHGKTTTSSLFTFLLNGLGQNPSFLIGGMPGNFGQGFGLNSRDLFVLEGDEYDSAFFDKGPKFLHYEPSITLINNIEFDHADIYDNIEAIEKEFTLLAQRTRHRGGFNIVNWGDPRVQRIANNVQGHVIAFCHADQVNAANTDKTAHVPFPLWVLNSFETNPTGITMHMTAPNQTSHTLFCAQIFGAHNALNILGVLAGVHAQYLLNHKTLEDMLADFTKFQNIFQNFKGVKRRFELLTHTNNIAVFDDFAHHPTAIRTTLQAFRDYIALSQKNGRLIVCFDPHNATMRRNILQNELAKSFMSADMLLLGKIPKDLRMDQAYILDANKVIESCGIKARYFDENQKLLDVLKQEARSNDTIVFMSSGSFDGIPHQFVQSLQNQQKGT